MGCIKIESFEEVDPFERKKFGKNVMAHVDAKQTPKAVHVNVNDIAQFEDIEINAMRPNTTENKVDLIDGVRILTHTGNIYLIFADSNHSFCQAFDLACGGGSMVVFDATKSNYLQQFKK